MEHKNRKQHILVAGILLKDGEVLLVRARNMRTPPTDTEYYDVPAWILPFGQHPQSYVEERFSDLFNVPAHAERLSSVTSYMRSGEYEQKVLIAYHMSTQADMYTDIVQCENVRFIGKEEIDAYVFSEHIKEILKRGFSF